MFVDYTVRPDALCWKDPGRPPQRADTFTLTLMRGNDELKTESEKSLKFIYLGPIEDAVAYRWEIWNAHQILANIPLQMANVKSEMAKLTVFIIARRNVTFRVR